MPGAEAVQGIGGFGEPGVGGHDGRSRRISGGVGLGPDDGAAQMADGVAGMAGLALGLIDPGSPLRPGGQVIVAAHGQHIAVAALTGLAGGGHGAPQALGVHPRMALVAGRGAAAAGDDGRIAGSREGAVHGQAVVLVHGPGQVLGPTWAPVGPVWARSRAGE